MIDIHEIDLLHGGVPGAISAWLVRGPKGDVLIESGPASTLAALFDGLSSHGIEPASLDACLLTHIHLDHAGGAWALASLGVPVHVHQSGAPHLLDPSRLNRSARRIFGERFDALWGELHPCPRGTVHAVHDGDVVHAGGLRFHAMETRGHADHHHCWHLLENDGVDCFAGDAAAMRLPGTDWITVPMPPPEFNLAAWFNTIDLLGAGCWRRLHLTHCGTVIDIDAHLTQLRESMHEQVAWIRHSQRPDRSARRAEYRSLLRNRSLGHHVPEQLFDAHVSRGLLDMNLAGVDRAFREAD